MTDGLRVPGPSGSRLRRHKWFDLSLGYRYVHVDGGQQTNRGMTINVGSTNDRSPNWASPSSPSRMAEKGLVGGGPAALGRLLMTSIDTVRLRPRRHSQGLSASAGSKTRSPAVEGVP